MNRLGAAAGVVLGAAVLHVATAVPVPFRLEPFAAAVSRLSPDVCLVAALALVGRSAGRPRLLAHAGAALLLLLALFRTAVVLVRLAFEREFELADLPWLVPSAWHFCLGDLPPWQQWAAGAVVVTVLAALQWLLARALAAVAVVAATARGAVAALATLQAAVLAAFVGTAIAPTGRTWCREFDAAAFAAEAVRSVRVWLDPAVVEEPIRARIAAGHERMQLAAAGGGPRGLHGVDVHVLIVESYGRTVLRQPDQAPVFRALWRELGAELQAAGFDAVSTAAAPAILGGASWLAHAELFTGVRVPDQRSRDLLLRSELQPLPARFAAAGWHTVEVMPAMPHGWPEGQRFYGFAASWTQPELAYRGTPYEFGAMPDQYALHVLLERVVRPATQPLFTVFVGASSHAPWSAIPPYLSDWRIGDATFAGPPARRHPAGQFDVPFDPRLPAAYADALQYALRAAAGFVCRLPRPSLVLLLGDHQPPIVRVLPSPDLSYDVPVHAISNRPDVLARLRAAGWADGFDLPEAHASRPLAELAPALLQAFAP